MSVAVAEMDTPETEVEVAEDYTQYRALSSLAVAALMVGVLSLLAFLHPWFVAIPVVGVLLGIAAIKQVRARTDELTGDVLAKAGLALAVLFGILGPSYQAVVYATEVPDGATRISYAELQPNPDQPGQLVPQSALDLNGKQVFIKGFVYPGKDQTNIQRFVLCRDSGDCCFGGDPKITDRIEVTLKEPLRLSYSQRMFKVAGKFRVEPGQTAQGIGAVFYHLDADYLR